MTDSYRPRDWEAGPLAGIRVIDLSGARSGPTCVRQLADMGADVIQVRARNRADLGGSDAHNLHRNKRSILIDLQQQPGRDVFYRLVERADVLVENFRPAVKRRLGIDYDTLAPRNPGLVYASISGFGQDGPYRERRGLDQIVQGLSGLMSVTGPPGTGPWRTGIAISDTVSGTFLTQGVLAALFVRERTGRGQWVHTSLLESMINFMDFQAMRWLVDGVVPHQAGNDHPTLTPMGTYATSNGHINVAAMMGWERFLEAIDGQELGRDPRFADWKGRLENRLELNQAIEARLRTRTSAEWVERLNAADIPCGPVLALDEVFADPQVKHLQMTRSVDHDREGRLDLLRLPLTFSATPAGIRTPPPRAGAHSREVLVEHGFGEAEISELFASGCVAGESGDEGWPTPDT